ncbi:phage major tail protein, TP901-1 family [Lactobacillus sp.]|uniref:phage major tail protein, TP901-1 family n=1 Tax=Lactobacillus sp. TaxID=1591 RepID=UPI0019C99EDD|nr:phage major tail protein, TP901-1 family [Lactobacillus sp.]MBD5429998.1 phage major tail protein, TP901-1 family [Lactobacillus sp.]
MAKLPEAVQGINWITYFRLLENEGKEDALLVPWEDSGEFNRSRDSESKTTKSGSITTGGGMESEMNFECADTVSALTADLDRAINKNLPVEIWRINHQIKNGEGKYLAYYMQGVVSENNLSADNDDTATRSITVTGKGTPQKGWLGLTDDQEAELDYVFRGIKQLKDDDQTGEGVAFDEESDRELSF